MASSSISRISHDTLTDLDRLLYHEDFPNLLSLALQLKELYRHVHQQGGNDQYSQHPHPRMSLTPNEIMAIVDRLHSQVTTQPATSIRYGDFPITDSILREALTNLQKELQHCQAWLQGQLPAQPRKKKSTDAIAVKYDKWQTDILMNWMIAHSDQPFPDAPAVAYLQTLTGLSHSQVVNWTTNVRKRNRKATLAGKKPHHFIDFLFLVQEQQQQKQGEQQQTTRSTLQDPKLVSPIPPSYGVVKQQQPPQPEVSSHYYEEPPLVPKSHTTSLSSSSWEQELLWEPLPVTTVPNEEVLQDFADLWLAELDDLDELPDLAEWLPDDDIPLDEDFEAWALQLIE